MQLFLCLLTTIGFGQEPNASLVKKMRKVVAQSFSEGQLQLDPVSDKADLKNGHLYPVLTSEEVLLGYAFLGYVPSKTDTFDYLVVFDSEFINILNCLNQPLTDFSTQVLPELVGKIATYHTDDTFLDVGTPDNLVKAREHWSPTT